MAIRRLNAFAALLLCLVVGGSTWADTGTFSGLSVSGQGQLSFTPGLGNELNIGAGSGGNGALITDFFASAGICGGDCAISGGYLTLTTGAETGGSAAGGIWDYTFGSGGTIDVYGRIASLGITTSALLFSATMNGGGNFSGAGTVGAFTGKLDAASIYLDPLLGTYSYLNGTTNAVSISLDRACGNGGSCTGPIIESSAEFSASALTATPEPPSFFLAFGAFIVMGMVFFGLVKLADSGRRLDT